MTQFKVGDKVRRINHSWNGVQVGDVEIIDRISGRVIFLVGRKGNYAVESFEKVEEVKTERRQWADIIIAWANGAKVQVRVLARDYVGEWVDVEHPAWDGYGQKVEYRIKPEPKPDLIYYGAENNPLRHSEECGGWRRMQSIMTSKQTPADQVKYIFDGETGKLKAVEILA